MHRDDHMSNIQPASPPGDKNKYSLFSTGLQNRIISDPTDQSHAHVRSKASVRSRPGSANRSRTIRSSTMKKSEPHEDTTEDLVHTIIELKKQLNHIESHNSQLKADNQRLDSEVTKQQHRIDKIMAPQFAKNGHLVVEIRKEIEKSVLVRQLKAQILSMRQALNEKTSQMDAMAKRMNATHLVEIMTEKEEFYAEVQRLRHIVAEQESELKKLRNNTTQIPHSDYEADLRQEVDRLTVGYAEVLQKLEQRPATTSAGSRSKHSHSSGSKKRPQSASLTRSRLTKEIESSRSEQEKAVKTPAISKDDKAKSHNAAVVAESILQDTMQPLIDNEPLIDGNRTAPYSQPPPPAARPAEPPKQAPPVKSDPATTKPSPRSAFGVGDTVEGNFNGEGIWYVGVIRSVGNNGYNIAYNDGDNEVNVPASRIRLPGTTTPVAAVKEEEIPVVQPAFKVGDRVEGKFGGGEEWFIGTVDAVSESGGKAKYCIRYDDGDYETNVDESNVRTAPIKTATSPKHEQPTPPSTVEPTPTKTASTPSAAETHMGAFRVNDAVMARYRGMAREYPGVISKAHNNNTYDVHYDDGERETHVAGDLIRLKQPVVPAPTPLYNKGMKVLANYKEYGTYYPATVMRATPSTNANATTIYYDIIYDFGETETVPEECLRSEAPDSDDIPIESRVSVNYERSGKWFNGKVHSKHSSGYVIHYDDGTVEQNVSADCIKLLSSSPVQPATAFKAGDAVMVNYRKKGTFLPAVVTRVNRNNTYDITYNDNKVEYEVAEAHIRAAEATPAPPPAPATAASSGESTPRTAARKGLGVGWSLVKTAFLKPPAGGGGDNAPLSVNQSIIARYRRQPEWIQGTVLAKRLAGKAFDILYENGEKEYGVPREYIRTLENSTVDATATAPPTTYPEYKVHDKVYGRYLGKGKWFPGVVVYVRKFDGSYDVEYELPYTPYHDIEKKVKPQYLKYREDEPQVAMPATATTASEASLEPLPQQEEPPQPQQQENSSSSRNVTFSGVDNVKHIEAEEYASPTSPTAASGEKGFDDDLDDFLANLSDDGVDDLDYGGLRTEKAVMLDENGIDTEVEVEAGTDDGEGYYDDFES